MKSFKEMLKLDNLKNLAVMAFLGGVLFAFPPVAMGGAAVWLGIQGYQFFFQKKK